MAGRSVASEPRCPDDLVVCFESCEDASIPGRSAEVKARGTGAFRFPWIDMSNPVEPEMAVPQAASCSPGNSADVLNAVTLLIMTCTG